MPAPDESAYIPQEGPVSDQDVAGESTRARKTPRPAGIPSRPRLPEPLRSGRQGNPHRSASAVFVRKKAPPRLVRRVAPSSDGSAAPSDKADALVPAPAGIILQT